MVEEISDRREPKSGNAAIEPISGGCPQPRHQPHPLPHGQRAPNAENADGADGSGDGEAEEEAGGEGGEHGGRGVRGCWRSLPGGLECVGEACPEGLGGGGAIASLGFDWEEGEGDRFFDGGEHDGGAGLGDAGELF